MLTIGSNTVAARAFLPNFHAPRDTVASVRVRWPLCAERGIQNSRTVYRTRGSETRQFRNVSNLRTMAFAIAAADEISPPQDVGFQTAHGSRPKCNFGNPLRIMIRTRASDRHSTTHLHRLHVDHAKHCLRLQQSVGEWRVGEQHLPRLVCARGIASETFEDICAK